MSIHDMEETNKPKRGGLFGGIVIVDEEDEPQDSGSSGLFSSNGVATKELETEEVEIEFRTEPLEVKTKEKPVVQDSDNLLTPEEKLSYYADRLISSVFGQKNISDYALKKITGRVKPSVFRNENFILYTLLYKNIGKVSISSIDYEFVRYALDINRDFVEKVDGTLIDINAYGDLEGSTTLGYIAGVLKHFNRLMTLPELSEVEFDHSLDMYMMLFKAIEANKIYRNSSIILTDGMRVKGKNLVGFDDSSAYVTRSLADLEGLMDANLGSGFTKMKDIILGGVDVNNTQPEKIGDFGDLKALNNIHKGLYTQVFYQVIAPAKGGKSKFCARVCHNIQVLHGNNVTVWPFEGGKDAWTAQMRAIHFDHTYNNSSNLSDRKFGVDQQTIQFDTFATPDLRDLEMVSSLDLASNPEYGSIDFIDRPFVVETFIQDIDASVKENGSKAVIIDYLQMIKSQTNMSERECVARAYPALLDYCKKNNVLIFTPAQYKQEVVDRLSSMESTEGAEMRVSAGVSAEVFRTPDVTIALWGSGQDLANKRMKLLSLPTRYSPATEEIKCYVDLAVCKFASIS